VISTAIQYRFQPYPDGFGHGIIIQDAGIPAWFGWYLTAKFNSVWFWPRIFKLIWKEILKYGKKLYVGLRLHRLHRETNIGDDIARFIDADTYLRKSYILLGMGRDRNDGFVRLSEDDKPVIKWKMKNSKLHYDRTRREMKKIAVAMGGRFQDNPLTYLDKMIAVHPLGGCRMAEDPKNGVVNTQGEAFGHPGLYVVDASIIPTSIGPNPSLTIAALAEYIADQFPKVGK
jgi:cholesterol oxidase